MLHKITNSILGSFENQGFKNDSQSLNIVFALIKYQFLIVFNLQISNISNNKRPAHFLRKLTLGLFILDLYKYWIILYKVNFADF